MLKARKAEQRRTHMLNADRGEQSLYRLPKRVLDMVPESLREAAIERCLARMDACETVADLPPGYALEVGAEGTWHVLPPGEPKSILLKGLTHPARELAIAFAWDLAEGRVDEEQARASALQVIEEWISRGDFPQTGHDAKRQEVQKGILGVLLAGELMTGYTWTADRYESDMASI